MNCQKCNSKRIGEVCAKCADRCSYSIGSQDEEGYVPDGLGIGGGDYLEFRWCLDCGQIQGNFPCAISDIEINITDEEVVEFFNNNFKEGNSIRHSMETCYAVAGIAKEMCLPFGKFVQSFLTNNSGHFPYLKFPSAEKFVEMYRNNQTELE